MIIFKLFIYPKKMQYILPIKLLRNNTTAVYGGSSSNSDYQYIKRFGRIGTSDWDIIPLWRTARELTNVEIQRTNSNESVDIELYLHDLYSNEAEDYYTYCESFNFKIFKATLLQNVKSCIISTNLCILPGCHYRGHIVINIPSDGKTDTKNVTSSSNTSELSDDLLRLLDNPSSFADATLKCESAEIPVHKCVLSIRSPVLAAMFTSQMQEGLTSTLLVTDIKLDVLKATLKYIYSGKTDNLTDVLAGDMLFAADKYQIDKLKSICVAKLKSSMKVDNITRILVLGELHDKGLKAAALDFLCRLKRFSDLEKSEEWKSLEEEYPRLAMEVTKSIVKFLQQTK